MKQMPSGAFRKAYPRLIQPVEVTALGRVIGTWFPAGSGKELKLTDLKPVATRPGRKS